MLCNMILDQLPDKTQNGFRVKTDFRQWIKFELLMQDNEINDSDKVLLSLNLVYYEIKDINQQIEDMLWFYSRGKDIKSVKVENKKSSQQIYSYEYDADLIFSAFYSQYNINLNTVQMHWWEFKALFEGLNDKTKMVEVMGYRAIDLSKIKDKDEKKRYSQLKKLYQLPDMRSAQEKEADFNSLFW